MVEVTLATAFGCPYTGPVAPDDVRRGRRRARSARRGRRRSAWPTRSAPRCRPRSRALVARRWRRSSRSCPVGVHLHDTRGLAIANALAAIDAGAVPDRRQRRRAGWLPVRSGRVGQPGRSRTSSTRLDADGRDDRHRRRRLDRGRRLACAAGRPAGGQPRRRRRPPLRPPGEPSCHLTTRRLTPTCRAGIVEGRYPPGSRFDRAGHRRALRVSRAPIREALRRLEADGFVVHRTQPGRRGPPALRLRRDDHYELRGRLESYAAELAAERRRPADLDAMRAAAERFSTAAAGEAGRRSRSRPLGEARALHEANRAFHDAVVRRGPSCPPRRAARRDGRRPAGLRRAGPLRPRPARPLGAVPPPDRRRHRRRRGTRSGRLMAEHIAQGRDMVRLIVGGSQPAHVG